MSPDFNYSEVPATFLHCLNKVQTLRQMYALPGDSLCPGQLPGNQHRKSKLF